MIVRIILPSSIEAAFRRDAIRAYPLEHAAAMRGRVIGDTVTITRFTALPHRSTEDETNYFVDDAIAPPQQEGDTFVGVAHSHPGAGSDAAPSKEDWKSAFRSGEIVMGIMVVEKRENGKFRTELEFYESRPPIAIVHPRVRAPRKKKADIVVTSILLDAIDPNASNTVQSTDTPTKS